jgi:triacylglycerol lipase
MFGFERISLGPVTIATYFRGIPNALRANGIDVRVAHVHPIAGIDHRAAMLGQWIERNLPAMRFHLIGHSLGGLDSRLLAAEKNWRGRIVSISTIGTPHNGTAIADAACIKLKKVYAGLERLGIDSRSFLDVTRARARAFHRSIRQPDEIPCFSLAGSPRAEDVCWPLRKLHDVLESWEGANDGLVPVRSALAFGEPLPTFNIDHLGQLNWLTKSGQECVSGITVAMYRALLEKLAEVEAFDQHRPRPQRDLLPAESARQLATVAR